MVIMVINVNKDGIKMGYGNKDGEKMGYIMGI